RGVVRDGDAQSGGEGGGGAAGGDGAGAGGVGVQLHGRAGFGAAVDRGAVVIRRGGGRDRERGRRCGRGRVLDVRDPGRARGHVPGRVGRGRVEAGGAVVGHRDAESGGERGGRAAGRDGARAGGVGVELDGRARLGGATDRGVVVVRRRGWAHRQRGRRRGRSGVLDVRDAAGAGGDVAGRVGGGGVEGGRGV